ncbi:hypothetical protein [Streptomyces sp. NPDC101181]|uniref:hypothetical protein n=1 Tax=Streptomyces sp. NPDC101181 TaxID=3366125 RepID=UPI00381DA9BA
MAIFPLWCVVAGYLPLAPFGESDNGRNDQQADKGYWKLHTFENPKTFSLVLCDVNH